MEGKREERREGRGKGRGRGSRGVLFLPGDEYEYIVAAAFITHLLLCQILGRASKGLMHLLDSVAFEARAERESSAMGNSDFK